MPRLAARGFTLTELVMTIVIIGILSVIVAPRFMSSQPFETRGFYDEAQAVVRYAQKVAIAQRRAIFVCVSANEIAAAKLVRFEQYNPQSQPKIVWPAAFPVVRSYLDQLVRNQGLATARTTAIATALNAAERATGAARCTALNTLAGQVDADARSAKDATKVRTMAQAIRDLAAASR